MCSFNPGFFPHAFEHVFECYMWIEVCSSMLVHPGTQTVHSLNAMFEEPSDSASCAAKMATSIPGISKLG